MLQNVYIHFKAGSSSYFASLYNVHVCDINGKKIMLFKGMLEERVKNV